MNASVAAVAGDFARLQSLLVQRKGYIPTDMAGNTALHWASAVGNAELVEEILRRGDVPSMADFEARDGREGGKDTEHADDTSGSVKKARDMLHVENILGDTPLHRAAWGGHAAVCSLLLLHKADAMAANQAGKTAADRARGAAFKVLAPWREEEDCDKEEETSAPVLCLNLSDTEYDSGDGESDDDEDDGWSVEELLGKQRLERLFHTA